MRSLTEGLEDKSSSSPAAESSGGGLRDTINSLASGAGGMVFLGLIAVGMVVFLVSRLMGALGPSPETVAPGQLRILNPLTGEMRWYTISVGGSMPDGYYPVEYCWEDHNFDGVPVILNQSLYAGTDPRSQEPTACPCCGAGVVGHNPKPEEFIGQTPSDYKTNQADPCVVEHYTQLLGG